MAKSRKGKIELFNQCKEILYKLIVDWKETPGKEEEIVCRKLKENVKKERMNSMIGKRKEKELSLCSSLVREQQVVGKKDDCKMTVKTTLKMTTHTECGKADQVAPNVARITERLSTRQNYPKKALNIRHS